MQETYSREADEPYLLLVAFCAGMAIMGIELTSSRLMAPYFGASLTIWTVIIASTMMSMALGYYVGGIVAERKPQLSLLAWLLLFASLFTVFLPYIAQPILQGALKRLAERAQAGAAHETMVFGLLLSAGILALPLIIFSMTSPFLIRLDSLRSNAVGRIAGKIFAVSTLGSIVGAFLPAFFLLPTFGVRLCFFVFGAVPAIVVLPMLGKGRLLGAAWALAALLLALLMGKYNFLEPKLLFLLSEKETAYQNVRIFRTSAADGQTADSGRPTFLVTDAALGTQSMWIPGKRSTDSWQDMFILAPRVFEAGNGKAPTNALTLGLGGGIAPYLISRCYPDMIFDGVELDPGLIQAARPYFPLDETPNLRLITGDARLFLLTSTDRYDVIVVDVFRPPHIPIHCATAEFFQQVKARLRPDGVMVMNVGSRGKEEVFSGISNTVTSVFGHVYYCAYKDWVESKLFTNYLLVAATKDFALSNPEVENRIFEVGDPEWKNAIDQLRPDKDSSGRPGPFFKRVFFDKSKPVFTDDLSSLDVISEREFLSLTLGADR